MELSPVFSVNKSLQFSYSPPPSLAPQSLGSPFLFLFLNLISCTFSKLLSLTFFSRYFFFLLLPSAALCLLFFSLCQFLFAFFLLISTEVRYKPTINQLCLFFPLRPSLCFV